MDEQDRESRQETLKAVLHYFYHDNTRSGAHCRYDLKYHLVWIPKYRRSVLTGEECDRRCGGGLIVAVLESTRNGFRAMLGGCDQTFPVGKEAP